MDDVRPETNSRSESKREKFARLRDARLPKITHALDILANLGGVGYEYTEIEARAIIDELDMSINALSKSFGLTMPRLTEPESVPENTQIVPATDVSTSDGDKDALASAPAAVDHRPDGAAGTPDVTTEEEVLEPVAVQSPSGASEPVEKRIVTHDVIPGFIAEGGATALSEISWAHDAIGKDNKLAKNRLRRIITAWRNKS